MNRLTQQPIPSLNPTNSAAHTTTTDPLNDSSIYGENQSNQSEMYENSSDPLQSVFDDADNLNNVSAVSEQTGGLDGLCDSVHTDDEITTTNSNLLNESQMHKGNRSNQNEIDRNHSDPLQFVFDEAGRNNALAEPEETDALKGVNESVRSEHRLPNQIDENSSNYSQLFYSDDDENDVVTTSMEQTATNSVVFANEEIETINSDLINESCVHDENSSNQNQVNENASQLSDMNALNIMNDVMARSDIAETEEKSTFEPVQVEQEELSAFGNLFNGAAAMEAIRANLGPDEKATVNSDGKIVITKLFPDDVDSDDDVECTYIFGEKPTPRNPEYSVKQNDPVSGDIPFKENVSFVFAYVQIQIESIQIFCYLLCFIF